MARSIWKGFYIDVNIIRRFDELLSLAIHDFLNRHNFNETKLTKHFLKENSLEILLIAKQYTEEEPIEVWSRKSIISPEFLGFSFMIYNGHVFQKVVIKDNMVGRKFGEFATTKRIGSNIHQPKKKKKKK